MSSTSGCTTVTKCSKCQKETNTADAVDAICKDCVSCLDATQKQEEKTDDCVKMEIDTDLTTTETLDDLDELDEKTSAVIAKQFESPEKEEQQQTQFQLEPKVKPEEPPACTEKPPSVVPNPTAATIKAEATIEIEVDAEVRESKMASACHAPPQRTGKITRSSLNGARSPTIMKRLRKSTRSTRFKAKLTGRGNNGGGAGAAGGGATNGYNGQGGGAAGHGGASTMSGAAGKAHGKLGTGGTGASPGGARNRRTLFKRPAQKTPRVQACTRFVKSVFYKGSYMQIGDIVSIVDSEQNVYYAQIRGLLVDAYCEKSAFLTWLIPTQDSPDPKDGFDPATYLIGPDEELSRKLCYLEFIMHAPSNYYFDRTTPFPLPDVDEYISTQRTGGFIWTRLPIIKRERERERERERKAAA